jgi:hypothetical protein
MSELPKRSSGDSAATVQITAPDIARRRVTTWGGMRVEVIEVIRKLIDPPPGFESNGFWFRNHEGVLIEVRVGPKVSPVNIRTSASNCTT